MYVSPMEKGDLKVEGKWKGGEGKGEGGRGRGREGEGDGDGYDTFALEMISHLFSI